MGGRSAAGCGACSGSGSSAGAAAAPDEPTAKALCISASTCEGSAATSLGASDAGGASSIYAFNFTVVAYPESTCSSTAGGSSSCTVRPGKAMPTGISSGCSTPTDVANWDISSASVTSAGSCATTSGAETSIDSNSAACVTATSIDGADVGSNSAGGASST